MNKRDLIRNLKRDYPAHYKNSEVLLHYSVSNESVYMLSNLEEYNGGLCNDFHRYKDKYKYSYWLCNSYSIDVRFYKVVDNLVTNEIGRL